MDQKIYELHAQMCEVFTSAKRLEILNLLRDKELSVTELLKLIKIRQSNLSQHLRILRDKGIVKTRKDGVMIYYSLTNLKIIKACDIMREILLEKLSQTNKLVQNIKKRR